MEIDIIGLPCENVFSFIPCDKNTGNAAIWVYTIQLTCSLYTNMAAMTSREDQEIDNAIGKRLGRDGIAVYCGNVLVDEIDAILEMCSLK